MDTTSNTSSIDDATLPLKLIHVVDLLLTPYHPIKLNNTTGWQYSINIPHAEWVHDT